MPVQIHAKMTCGNKRDSDSIAARDAFMKNRKKIATDGGSALQNNPFASLSLDGLPDGPDLPVPNVTDATTNDVRPGKRGRVDIVRQTAHRGGKTVTVISGFQDVSPQEMESLAKRMQKTCGVGGTVKGDHIEIQGDQRRQVADILQREGFRPVMAGG